MLAPDFSHRRLKATVFLMRIPARTACFVLAYALAACGGGGDGATASNPGSRLVDFSSETACVGADADYTAETAPPDSLSAPGLLPAPFNGPGWRLSGTNRSDDLFVYVKCKLSGLQPGQSYRVGFAVSLLTDAPSGCVGVGGPPGEGVTVHAGISATEPLTQRQLDGYFRVNLDRGNQAQGGSESQALGHIGNSVSNCASTRQFEAKFLAPAAALVVTPDKRGDVWLHVGIDSGFESYSEVYLRSVSIQFTPMAP
jgi:hypothetical protein